MEDINDEMTVVDESTNVIEPNLLSLSVDEKSSRFRGAEWFDTITNLHVTLAGLGGIGSHVAFLLSRIRVGSIVLYDGDAVEEANMSGQMYISSDCGMSKVDAAYRMMLSMSSYGQITAFDQIFTASSTLSTKIAICGFDNMDARKTYYYSWRRMVDNAKDEDKSEYLFIDGRLAAEEFQVLCITGDDNLSRLRYETEYLFPGSEADNVVCSYKQTTHIASMIASVIVNLLTNFATNLSGNPVKRALPFFTEYKADYMYFKTED